MSETPNVFDPNRATHIPPVVLGHRASRAYDGVCNPIPRKPPAVYHSRLVVAERKNPSPKVLLELPEPLYKKDISAWLLVVADWPSVMNVDAPVERDEFKALMALVETVSVLPPTMICGKLPTVPAVMLVVAAMAPVTFKPPDRVASPVTVAAPPTVRAPVLARVAPCTAPVAVTPPVTVAPFFKTADPFEVSVPATVQLPAVSSPEKFPVPVTSRVLAGEVWPPSPM